MGAVRESPPARIRQILLANGPDKVSHPIGLKLALAEVAPLLELALDVTEPDLVVLDSPAIILRILDEGSLSTEPIPSCS